MADTDGDGLLDGFEVTHGFDPLTGGEQGLDDDLDGLTNLQEQTVGTNPLLADTDGDTFDDGIEVAAGTDPLDDQDFPAAAQVPTLSPTGIALLALLLGAVGMRQSRGHAPRHRPPGGIR